MLEKKMFLIENNTIWCELYNQKNKINKYLFYIFFFLYNCISKLILLKKIYS